MQSGQPFPAPQIASRDTVLFFKEYESSFLTLQRHFYFSVWLLTFWLARFWALVDFKLKQYFHCSVISGPIIFCLLIACYSGDSLVMSEHLINSSAYYKLRLSVLKSPFWLVTLLGMVSSSLGKLAAFSCCDILSNKNKNEQGTVQQLISRTLKTSGKAHFGTNNESWVQKLVTIGQISLSQPKQQSGQPDLRGHALSQSGLKLITKIRR